MVQKNQNDEMYANNIRTLRFAVTDADATDPTDPLDLTGLVVKWALSRIAPSGQFTTTAIVEKCSNDGTLTITNPTGGLCELTLDPADTATLSGKFYHELEVFDSGDNGVVVATGEITILRNVVNTC